MDVPPRKVASNPAHLSDAIQRVSSSRSTTITTMNDQIIETRVKMRSYFTEQL